MLSKALSVLLVLAVVFLMLVVLNVLMQRGTDLVGMVARPFYRADVGAGVVDGVAAGDVDMGVGA